MRDADLIAFGELMTDALAFYGQEATKFTLGVWWQACQPFDLEQVRKALTAHAMDPQNGRFPPKPADLVRVLRGTHTDRALLAWGKVHESIRRVGAYASVVFDDPVVHAVVTDMGGWPALCRGKDDDLPFSQRRFCETYRAYAQRVDGVPYPAVLIGLHEASNLAVGYEPEAPYLIGDQRACEAVRLSGSKATRLSITQARTAASSVEATKCARSESPRALQAG